MKCFKYFAILLIFPGLLRNSSFGQKLQTADTSFILELINNSRTIRDSQPERSLQLVNDALQKSIASGFTRGMALAYARLGRWYFGNNIDTSVDFAQKALALLATENLPETRADMHLLLAEAYDEQGRTDSSAYYYYLLGDEAEAGTGMKPEVMIEIYTKLAIFWINLIEGSGKNEKITNTIRVYIDRVKKLSTQMQDTAFAASSVYFIQGIYYHGIKEYDSARYYYTAFLTARERLKKINVLRKISTLSNIASTYLEENRPAEAMPYLNRVKELGADPAQRNYLSFFMAFVGLLEGKALLQLKQYTAAIQVLEQSLDQLKTTGGHLRNEVADAYKDLADSYENLGDFRHALENKNIYSSLKDSLSLKEKLDMISRQEIRFRIAEKDKELIEQQLTIEKVNNKVRNKNAVIGGIAAIILFFGLLLITWRRRNIHKQKLQRQRIENLQQKIKIERLNATIAGEEKERTRIARELHDGIGGLLTAAKMNFELVKHNAGNEQHADFTQGLKLLEEAGVELRQAAKNLMPEVLLQEGLIKAVQVFCERVSEKSDAKISFQAFGDRKIVDNNFELSVYRIIQELVHNIVKHSKAKTALVQISFQADGGMQITVEDDGVGINKTTLTHKTGMGLKNIQDRIKETGGKFDIQSSEGKGTSVYIEYESP